MSGESHQQEIILSKRWRREQHKESKRTTKGNQQETKWKANGNKTEAETHTNNIPKGNQIETEKERPKGYLKETKTKTTRDQTQTKGNQKETNRQPKLIPTRCRKETQMKPKRKAK